MVDSMAFKLGFQTKYILNPQYTLFKGLIKRLSTSLKALSAYCSDCVVFDCPHPKVVGGSSITISSGNRPFLSKATPPAKMKIDTQLSPYSMCITLGFLIEVLHVY